MAPPPTPLTSSDVAIQFARLQGEVEHLRADLEKYRTETIDSLKAGASTFAGMRQEHAVFKKEIEDALRPSILRVIAVVAGGAIAFAGLIWKLSRYPDAEELKAYQERSNVTAAALKQEIQEQRADTREIKGAVQRAEERQRGLEEKLDKALSRRR